MPTVYELAQFSKNTFSKTPPPVTSWKLEETHAFDDGFAFLVYTNKLQNETVIAIRGPEVGRCASVLKNMRTMLQIILGLEPETVVEAGKVLKALRSGRTLWDRFTDIIKHGSTNQLTITGHGFGGLCAQLIGYYAAKEGKKYKVTTFENPGITAFIEGGVPTDVAEKFAPKSKTYVVSPNLFNASGGQHCGTLTRVHTNEGSKSFFSKTYDRLSHALFCIIADLIRLVLLALFVNAVYSRFTEKLLLTENRVQLIFNMLKMLIPEDSEPPLEGYAESFLAQFGLQLSLHSMLFVFIVMYSVAKAVFSLGEKMVASATKEHGIDAVMRGLVPKAGSLKQPVVMSSWPTRKQYLLSQLWHAATWLNPRTHHSILNICDDGDMEEARVKRTFGYREK